jgi:hypothetical protein
MKTLIATLSLVLFVTTLAFGQQTTGPSPKTHKGRTKIWTGIGLVAAGVAVLPITAFGNSHAGMDTPRGAGIALMFAGGSLIWWGARDQRKTAPTIRRGNDPTLLKPEDTTTLHVGDLAALTIRSDGHYSRFPGSTGNSVILMRRFGESLIYRAVRPGPDVIVVSPNVSEGECISCATVHYFIKVVPQH